MKTEYAARRSGARALTVGPGDETNGKYGKQLHGVKGDQIVVTVHFARAPPLPSSPCADDCTCMQNDSSTCWWFAAGNTRSVFALLKTNKNFFLNYILKSQGQLFCNFVSSFQFLPICCSRSCKKQENMTNVVNYTSQNKYLIFFPLV